jgi:hypothetical protein
MFYRHPKQPFKFSLVTVDGNDTIIRSGHEEAVNNDNRRQGRSNEYRPEDTTIDCG